MWPGNSVLIIINALASLVYSLPANIDWSDLQYDPVSVAQNENILQLFLQLAVHTANRLKDLRNETVADHDCNERKDNISHSISGVLIPRLLPQANLEWSEKNQDKIQNDSFIIDSETQSNDRVSLENLDQDQTTFFNSTESEELYNLSDFQEGPDVARNSNTSFDAVRRNYDVHNSDTLQNEINLYTTSNSSADEFSSDELDSTVGDISKRLFSNPIDLMENATSVNVLSETVEKSIPESENVPESTPDVSQRFSGVDLANNRPDTKIITDLQKDVNQFNRLSQSTQGQSNKNNNDEKIINPRFLDSTTIRNDLRKDINQFNRLSQSTQGQSNKNNNDEKVINPRFLDSTTIRNDENVLNPQIADSLPAVNQILSNAKHFLELMIKILPETRNARNVNDLLNHISQSQNMTNALLKAIEQIEGKFDVNLMHNYQNFSVNSGNYVSEPADAASEVNDKKREDNNNLSINTNNSKMENNNDKVVETKTNKNEQLNSILKNLSQSNDTSELSKDFATERLLNQLEYDASGISSTTKRQDKNSSSAQDLRDFESVSKSNVNSKELEDNPPTNIRSKRSIRNRNTRIDLSKSDDYSRFDNLKGTSLHEQLAETKPKIASLPVLRGKISNSENHMTAK